jgi:hypothetical protein
MKRSDLYLVLAGAALAACTTSGTVTQQGVTADGQQCSCEPGTVAYLPQTGDRDDCKVENSAIGQVGAQVTTGGVTVTFEEWTAKPGSPGEYLGFRISATVPVGNLSYTVKAGTATYQGLGATWFHPGGEGANAISNVDFCDPDGGGGDDGTGDDGGGDDSCNEPDGCFPDDGSGDDPCYCEDGGGDDGSGGDDSCNEPDGCFPDDGSGGGDDGSGGGDDGSGGDDGCVEPDGCFPDGGGTGPLGDPDGGKAGDSSPPAIDDGGGSSGCVEPDGCNGGDGNVE